MIFLWSWTLDIDKSLLIFSVQLEIPVIWIFQRKVFSKFSQESCSGSCYLSLLQNLGPRLFIGAPRKWRYSSWQALENLKTNDLPGILRVRWVKIFSLDPCFPALPILCFSLLPIQRTTLFTKYLLNSSPNKAGIPETMNPFYWSAWLKQVYPVYSMVQSCLWYSPV